MAALSGAMLAPKPHAPASSARAASCSTPGFAWGGRCSPPGAVLVSGAWGSAPLEFGRVVPEEGNPEGPRAVTFDQQRGELWVLDAWNRRIKIYRDANSIRTIPIPADTFEDLVLLDADRVAILDRLVERRIAVLDREGHVVESIALEDSLIASGGGTVGLYTTAAGLWVDYEDRSVRVATREGVALGERRVAPGHLSRDGRTSLAVEPTSPSSLTVKTIELASGERRQRVLSYSDAVLHVSLLRSDGSGRIYVATEHQAANGQVTGQVLVLSPELAEVRRIDVPGSQLALEVFRNVDVTTNGTVLVLEVSERSAQVRRY